MLATKLQGAIANEGSGQHAGFAQNLKPIADAQHKASIGCKFLDGLHDRAETGNRAGAEIIAVAEPARNDDGVGIAQRSFLVPEQTRRVTEDIAQDMDAILVAIRSGEL